MSSLRQIPDDAFAHARFFTPDRGTDIRPFASISCSPPSASADIAGTVARWREREADTGILDLGQFPQLEEQRSPAGFFTALAGLTAVGIFVMLGIGLFAAHAAGRF